ncbi:MAG: sulfite exporter TauE/SafE family protein, partial [Thermodesulfobacteriota bacterium]
MNQKLKVCCALLLLSLFVVVPLLLTVQAQAVTLEEAIAKAPTGTEKGQINPDTPKGWLGIPGGPKVNVIVALLWTIWVGWIFSTVGAFGGIMSGVGHMTVYGLGGYAKTFKTSAPALNKVLTDSIRVSNSWLVGFSAL